MLNYHETSQAPYGPKHLEMLIMLRFNKDLWDAREVDETMKRTTHTEIVSASSTPVPRSSLAGEMIGVGASSSSSSSSY